MADAREIIAACTAQGLTIAVAESLTGGLLVAELIRPSGASAVVNGGVVAYNTDVKRSLLDVDADLLRTVGPVHPDVAIQLARNVRRRLAVAGHPSDIGISTTGVAGPEPVDGHPPGTVYLGLSIGALTLARALTLAGTRDEIRAATVASALEWLSEALERGLADFGE